MALFAKTTALQRCRVALPLLALAGCGTLQNDINVPLPTYSAELVVECYLEPGQVPSLAVTTSVPYLATALPQVPNDVVVALILPNGTRVPLSFAPNYRALVDTTGEKFHSHIGRDLLVARPGDVFGLDVRDSQGRRATATTTMLAPVPIDSMEYKFNDKPVVADRRAYMLTNFRDPAPLDNCYRLLLHKGNPARGALRKQPETDISLEDRLVNGRPVTVGTSYRFYLGDTVTATLYHTDRAFYRFQRSVRDARGANGNPFGQPSAIYGNVQGGIGIFSVLSSARATKILR